MNKFLKNSKKFPPDKKQDILVLTSFVQQEKIEEELKRQKLFVKDELFDS